MMLNSNYPSSILGVKNPKFKKNKGGTLIELLISVAVISIAIVSIYAALVYGLTVDIKARNLAIAKQIASEEIENVRNTAYTSLTNQTNGPMISNPISELAQLRHSGSGTLTIIDYPSYTDVKQVTVTVSWIESNQNKSMNISTLVSKYGINQ